jgi:RNA polymerase sigma factor (sigma-70 family)
MTTGSAAAHSTIDAVWRLESARIIAGVARLVRDVGLAEELAQDALVAALEQWPAQGIPAQPGAWLMLTAKHRAIDRIRRDETLAGKLSLLGGEMETAQQHASAEFDAVLDDLDDERIDDDLLRLMFISCHPVLSTQARVALTLRLLGGLTTEEIARGLLTAESTIAKRITRAKRTLGSNRVPFEVPPPAARPARLASVLEVLYLIFNEGYSAMAGDDWMRPALCYEALRLGRVLAGLMPNEPEVHGLVALMEIQASRIPARLDPDGLPVPLPEQNRGRWDHLLIRRGFTAMLWARRLGQPPGPYVLQAAIAVCHAQARTAAETDWRQIAMLYEALAALTPSPVVELNRAVAVAMADGAEQGLRIVDGLAAEPALAGYHHLPSVRGDLLARLGRHGEAAGEFRRAAALTRNAPERTVLLRRAGDCEARLAVSAWQAPNPPTGQRGKLPYLLHAS